MNFNQKDNQILYEKLLEEVKEDRVDRWVHKNIKDLEGFTYNAETQFKRTWNPYNSKARGIVFYRGNLVSRPFERFANIEEVGLDILLEKEIKSISTKEDGSLIVVSWFPLINDVLVTTKGSFHSPQAEAAKILIDTKYPKIKEFLEDVYIYGSTLLFEYVGPSNKNVTRTAYPEDELILLAEIETVSGYEYPTQQVNQLAAFLNCRSLTLHEPSLDLYEKINQNENPNFEGVVCRFTDGSRVKIKTELYKKLHRVLTGEFTPSRLIEIWETGLKDSLSQVPDEFFKELDEKLALIDKAYDDYKTKTQAAFNRMYLDKENGSSRGELARNYPAVTFLLPILFSGSYQEAWSKLEDVCKKTFIRKYTS